MTICFSLAENSPLRGGNYQAQALAMFAVANNKKADLSGDASKGAVWKAAKKGLEPLAYPPLKTKGILFVADVYYGLYPSRKGDQYVTYEALLDGQRYAITFRLKTASDAVASDTGHVPFIVQRIAEFSSLLKAYSAAQVQQPAPVVSSSSSPPDTPGAFYANVGNAPALTGFYADVGNAPAPNGFYQAPPKVIQGSGSIVSGKQQPLPKMVGPIIASGI